MDVPVIAFIGWPGAGKTSFLEKLIPILGQKGLRTALLKSDGHDFDVDMPGKDTWRFTQAGAPLVAISNGRHAAFFENRPLDFPSLLSRLRDVDLVLAEGWHSLDLPQIEVWRDPVRPLRCTEPTRLLALVGPSDKGTGLPCFSPEDAAGAAAFLLSHFQLGQDPSGAPGPW